MKEGKEASIIKPIRQLNGFVHIVLASADVFYSICLLSAT